MQKTDKLPGSTEVPELAPREIPLPKLGSKYVFCPWQEIDAKHSRHSYCTWKRKGKRALHKFRHHWRKEHM